MVLGIANSEAPYCLLVPLRYFFGAVSYTHLSVAVPGLLKERAWPFGGKPLPDHEP